MALQGARGAEECLAALLEAVGKAGKALPEEGDAAGKGRDQRDGTGPKVFRDGKPLMDARPPRHPAAIFGLLAAEMTQPATTRKRFGPRSPTASSTARESVYPAANRQLIPEVIMWIICNYVIGFQGEGRRAVALSLSLRDSQPLPACPRATLSG